MALKGVDFVAHVGQEIGLHALRLRGGIAGRVRLSASAVRAMHVTQQQGELPPAITGARFRRSSFLPEARPSVRVKCKRC